MLKQIAVERDVEWKQKVITPCAFQVSICDVDDMAFFHGVVEVDMMFDAGTYVIRYFC